MVLGVHEAGECRSLFGFINDNGESYQAGYGSREVTKLVCRLECDTEVKENQSSEEDDDQNRIVVMPTPEVNRNERSYCTDEEGFQFAHGTV
jgi:hypothetical protein